MSNRKLIALLAGILVFAAVLGGILYLTHPKGTQVVVTVDGKEYGAYDLHANQTVVIQPKDGSWHNTLEIQDGRAGIVESDCDNQICVHTPALQEDLVGLIICLPHGLVVELRA